MRYFSHRLKTAGVKILVNTRANVATLSAGFDDVVLATGVTPRTLDINGIAHPKVMNYLDAINGTHPVGKRVAIIGAGGIGFDTAEFLLHGDPRQDDHIGDFQKKWGVDSRWASNGAGDKSGLAISPAPPRPIRQIYLLQRGDKFGRSLGKTTGWIHKAEMALGGVKMIGGVTYKSIDDAGLHIEVLGKTQILAVDNIIVCAGQVSNDDLLQPLKNAGVSIHVIGGAEEAGELDAKRAILAGLKLANEL